MENKDYKVDMHIHTDASDGTWSIEDVIMEVRKNNIRVFSVTDHDTIENSILVNKLKLDDLIFILGAEISVTYNDKEYHITAYDFDCSDVKLNQLLMRNRTKRIEYNGKLVKKIKKLGLLDNIDDYDKYIYNKHRGGWKSLNYFIDKGLISDIKGFFDLVNISGEKLEFEHPREVIEIIKDAGGYCFLAHPSAYNKGSILSIEELNIWNDFGINGIECYSPYLSKEEDANYYIDYCNKNNLLISAGSDCHGAFNNRKLGNPSVRYDDILIREINSLG